MLAATLGLAAASKIIDHLTTPSSPSTGYADAQENATRPRQPQQARPSTPSSLHSQLLHLQECRPGG